MKKVIATLCLILTVSFSYAQKNTIKQLAQANTKEMTKVLSLDRAQEKVVFDINLEKNSKLKINKANKSLTAEEKKAAQTAIYKEAQIAFKTALGNAKLKEWNVFKNAQTAARKKKNK